MPRIYRLWRAEGTGTELYVGLGGPHAVAQFWDAEKERASFDAMAPQISASGSVDFLLGGTPTPMPPEYWLKPEDAVRVATYFLETGERHPDYKWRPG